jgi:hypothetical protein
MSIFDYFAISVFVAGPPLVLLAVCYAWLRKPA